MRSFEEGSRLFCEAIPILTEASRPDLMKKLWRSAPTHLKNALNKMTKQEFKTSIDDMISEEVEYERARNQFFDEMGDFLSDDDIEDNGYESDFFTDRRFQHKKEAVTLNENDRIRIKSLFRKIVRKIHPDHLKNSEFQNLKSWFDIIWKKVALAHENNDLVKLTQLHNKIMIVLKDYGELSLSELNTAAQSLESEHKELLRDFADIKNNPAWNFSQMKDYRKLQKAQSKPYLQRQKLLDKDLNEIKIQRAGIERLAGLIKEGKIKPKSTKPKRRAMRKRQATSASQDQMSFLMK